MLRFRNATAATLALFALSFVTVESTSAQTGPIARKGDLHVLAVGISQHDQAGNDLFWADQDAIDHVEFWATQKGKLFGKVESQKLLNKQANRTAILRAMEETVKQAKAGDTVVAPFSGHGTDPKGGEWRFCAADCGKGGYISADEFREWAGKLTKNGVKVTGGLQRNRISSVRIITMPSQKDGVARPAMLKMRMA